MRRWLVFLYGVVNYVIFLGTFLYLAGFLGNLLVPKSIDSGTVGPLSSSLAIDVLLIGLFGLQHTVMARPTFKVWWTHLVPRPIERSTYVLFTNVTLGILFCCWQPIPTVVWDVAAPAGRTAMYGLFAFGWLTVLVTTFLINHFDLFGLRQVWLYLRGKPYTHLRFVSPGPYRFVRHPLYVGWMMAFWATPTMTVGHLVFAAATTAYMLVAIWFEERNLLEFHGDHYAEYRRRTPMLIPGWTPRGRTLAHNGQSTSSSPV